MSAESPMTDKPKMTQYEAAERILGRKPELVNAIIHLAYACYAKLAHPIPRDGVMLVDFRVDDGRLVFSPSMHSIECEGMRRDRIKLKAGRAMGAFMIIYNDLDLKRSAVIAGDQTRMNMYCMMDLDVNDKAQHFPKGVYIDPSLASHYHVNGGIMGAGIAENPEEIVNEVYAAMGVEIRVVDNDGVKEKIPMHGPVAQYMERVYDKRDPGAAAGEPQTPEVPSDELITRMQELVGDPNARVFVGTPTELLAMLNKQNKIHDAQAKPWQKAIKPGDFYKSIDDDLVIYGEILQPENAPEDLPLSENRRLVRAYSVSCPEGEMGTVHVAGITAHLTKEGFEKARAGGWK